MRLPNTAGQGRYDFLFDASGSVGTTAAILLPRHKNRSHFIIANLNASNTLYVEFGGARATATITNGAVTGFTVTNAGFNYTRPPIVRLWGGGYGGNTATIACGQPGEPAPGDTGYAYPNSGQVARIAQAHCTLSSSAIAGSQVASIVIDDPGAGYGAAPFVFLESDPLDPFGVAIPSATSGLPITANGGSYYVNGTVSTTDAISIISSGSSTAFACKWTY